MLAPQLPYPPHQGTSMRNFNLLVHLARRHEVHLCCFSPPNTPPDALESLRAHMSAYCAQVVTVPQPTRSLGHRLWTTLTSSRPDMAYRLASPAMHAALSRLLAQTRLDVIQFEGIEMIPYLPTVLAHVGQNSSPVIVFDDHNAEYLLQKRVFESDLRVPRRWPGAAYSLIQWQKLARYEAWACRRADAVVAVSEQDAAALRRLVPGFEVTVVPNGVDVGTYASFQNATPLLPPHSLLFTGTMDFRPNVDAVLWFADHVWERVRVAVPDVQFYIVGQRPHRRLDALRGRSGIVITGGVPDTRPYFADAEVYVIPLQSGGGTRLKVLEALAMKKPIVSTTMGCDGYPLTSGREVILADDPAGFAQAVIALLNDPARRKALGEAGFAFAQRYDWANLVPQLEQVYCCAASPSRF